MVTLTFLLHTIFDYIVIIYIACYWMMLFGIYAVCQPITSHVVTINVVFLLSK